MDDMNNNNPGSLDNFEFEDYSNQEENNPPAADNSPAADNGANQPDDTSFEEYKDDNNADMGMAVIPDYDAASDINNKNEKDKDKNQDDFLVPPPLTAEEEARIAKRRAKKKEEQRKIKEEEDERGRSITTTMVVFCALLFVMWIVYYSLTNMLPDRLMDQGKKYLGVHEYTKAYQMFHKASKARPYDEEPVTYEIMALSNMPPTYENQLALFDISQNDDFDDASAKAEAVIINMKKQIDRKAGPNYASNALYNDILFRWNQKEPVKYTIKNNNNSPVQYLDSVRQAFKLWSTASNGEIVFQELLNTDNADIVVNLQDKFAAGSVDDFDKSGDTKVIIHDDVLDRAEIVLRTRDNYGGSYGTNAFRTLAEHEIGHALGIWGHSSNPKDIMYYTGDYISYASANKGLSARDANTINLLYQMVPDVINQPINPHDRTNLFYHYVITSIPGDDFELETQRLTSTLNKDRGNIVAWVDLGINYGLRKHYKRSNAIFHKILPLTYSDPANQFVVLYNMASNFYKLRDYNTARKFLNLAERINIDVDTQTLDAFIDFKLKEFDIAKGKLIILNKKYPDHIEVALKLARIYYSNNEIIKAQEVLENLLKYNPDALRDRRVMKYRKYMFSNNKVNTYVRPKEKVITQKRTVRVSK